MRSSLAHYSPTWLDRTKFPSFSMPTTNSENVGRRQWKRRISRVLKSCGYRLDLRGMHEIKSSLREQNDFLTWIQASLNRSQCIPGPATSLNKTDALPFFRCSYEVCTLNSWLFIQRLRMLGLDAAVSAVRWDIHARNQS